MLHSDRYVASLYTLASHPESGYTMPRPRYLTDNIIASWTNSEK